VLYLAFYFPPTRASGVYRARAFANVFADSGWDVTVFTAPERFFSHSIKSVDPSLLATVDPRVTIVRPHMDLQPWETDIRRFSRLHRTQPIVWEGMRRTLIKQTLSEPYITWLPAVFREAVKRHRKEKFDLVMATGNPFSAFVAAGVIGRMLKIPYVIDYRDAWTFDQFSETMRYPDDHRVMAAEKWCLDGAAEALVVNDGMRQWYAERYPEAADHVKVVLNGWEPDILGEVPPRVPDPARPLSFRYLGTVTDPMPLEELFSGWELARKGPVLDDATLDVYGHLGFFPHAAARVRARFPEDEVASGVHYHGAVSKTEVGATYAGADVLVFSVPGARFVTSGKVFEYMATGRPIVSVHQRGLAAEEVLADYPLWFPAASLEPDDVAAAFSAAGAAARTLTAEQQAEAAASALPFARETVIAPFEERMRALVSGG